MFKQLYKVKLKYFFIVCFSFHNNNDNNNNREPGYVCIGGNSTSIVPDKCVLGSYSLSVDFNSYGN